MAGRKVIMSIGLIAALGLGAGAFVYRMGYAPLEVEAARAIRDTPIEVFALGTIEARIVSRIAFRVAGTIVDLAADHGDRVAAGAPLARLDAREQAARAAKARSGVASAEAAVAVAEAAAERASVVHAQRQQTNQRRQTLLARGAIAIEQAEEAQLTEATARADTLVTRSEVAAARARLADARSQAEFETVVLAQHDLRAPFAGLVVNRAKELGGVVAPGEAVFTLVDPATYWILAYLDEGRAGAVTVGQEATIRLRSLPGRVFRGRVERIGLEGDRVNEERRVHVACHDCPGPMVLGEQAEVIVRTGAVPSGVFVPEKAIEGYNHGRGTVWAVADGLLVKRAVRLGQRTLDGRYEIVDGLADAMAVVSRHPRFWVGRAATIAASGS